MSKHNRERKSLYKLGLYHVGLDGELLSKAIKHRKEVIAKHKPITTKANHMPALRAAQNKMWQYGG